MNTCLFSIDYLVHIRCWYGWDRGRLSLVSRKGKTMAVCWGRGGRWRTVAVESRTASVLENENAWKRKTCVEGWCGRRSAGSWSSRCWRPVMVVIRRSSAVVLAAGVDGKNGPKVNTVGVGNGGQWGSEVEGGRWLDEKKMEWNCWDYRERRIDGICFPMHAFSNAVGIWGNFQI